MTLPCAASIISGMKECYDNYVGQSRRKLLVVFFYTVKSILNKLSNVSNFKWI